MRNNLSSVCTQLFNKQHQRSSGKGVNKKKLKKIQSVHLLEQYWLPFYQCVVVVDIFIAGLPQRSTCLMIKFRNFYISDVSFG
jgi:hypothetical protein